MPHAQLECLGLQGAAYSKIHILLIFSPLVPVCSLIPQELNSLQNSRYFALSLQLTW